MVVIMNSWIVTLYPSAPLKKLVCLRCHSFYFLLCLPRTCLFVSNSTGASRKAEDAYSTRAPGLCFQPNFKWSLGCFYFCLVYVRFFVVIVFFLAWSLSLDYILLISATILVPLITLLLLHPAYSAIVIMFFF